MRKKKTVLSQKRIWEIDALRGLLMLCVLATHLYYTIDAFCVDGYYNIDSYAYVNASDPLHFWFDWGTDGKIYRAFLPDIVRETWVKMGVDTFFIISGISYHFSRNNLYGGFRLLLGAAFISAFTKLVSIYSGEATQFIRFGVLHCYALCHLICYFLLENRSNKFLLFVAGISLALGYYLRTNPIYIDLPFLVPFGIRENGVYMRDYWPVFPMLGWFLIGIVLGRKFYSEKITRFPKLAEKRWHKPLQFMGRYSGLIYCGHMVVYTLVFCGIGYIFALF